MAPPIPDQLPATFTAGETLKFRRAFSDYPPADGWRYKIFLNGATDTLCGDGIVDGDGFLVNFTPAQTAIGAGVYRFAERVLSEDGTEVYTVNHGVIEVEFDIATAPAGATLSFAEQMLVKIEAEIAKRLDADVEEYSVQASTLGGGRSVKKIPMETLQKLRGRYASMVWRAKNPGKVGAKVQIDFLDETGDQDFPPTWTDVTGLPGAGQ
jgi:hypothetical protein